MKIQQFCTHKILVIILVFSLIISGVTFGNSNDMQVNASNADFSDVILYVGGSEEGNYSSIQHALDNASNHTTIYIYQGIYKENIVINKSIHLTGEDKSHTVIDGNDENNVIIVLADSVIISNLTIKNSGTSEKNSGILINSTNVTVTNSIITRNLNGIFCQHANDSQIFNNEITFSLQGGNGLVLNHTTNILISNNTIRKNKNHGIIIKSGSTDNIILKNNIENNDQYGVYIYQDSSKNQMYYNSFKSKGIAHAYDNCSNFWDNGYPIGGNWWDDYDEIDELYGPNQNLSGSDMRGDTSYEIQPDGKNNDSYPLIDGEPELIVDDDYLDIIAGWNQFRFRSIQNAINHAEPYDVITIKGGIYPESLFIDKSLVLNAEGDDVIVDGNHTDSVIIVNASNVQITGLIIEHSGNESNDSAILVKAGPTSISKCLIRDSHYGIFIQSSNNEIFNNKIRSNLFSGIYIKQGLLNNIKENEISYNQPVGILILGNKTNQNKIEQNHIHHNNGEGLKLTNTSNNTIIKNNITDNSGSGIALFDQSFFNTIKDNLISSNVNNGIHLQGVNTIKNPTLIQSNKIMYQKDSGIHLIESKNCTIISNEIRGNEIGISMQNATKNNVFLNIISRNNNFGLFIDASEKNHIYNNNIRNEEVSTAFNAYDNSQNFWNGSYCIGGNHWDGHEGADEFHGEDQKKEGKDGIYDTSYLVMTSEDHYPFVNENGWNHRLLIESVHCGWCGDLPHWDLNLIKGLSVNIINYGQNPTKTDMVLKVNELIFNNTFFSRMQAFEKTYELNIGSEDALFISVLTDDSLWRGRFLRVGMAEITIDLDIVTWKGKVFCYRSRFFLLNEEIQ